MKKLFVLVALMLASCIDVEDFGVFWNKGTIDPALEGKWKAIAEDKTQLGVTDVQNVNYPQELNFVKDGNSYLLKYIYAANESIPTRCITLGNYQFLMVKDRKGGIDGYLVRYKIEGNKVAFFHIHNLYQVMQKYIPEIFYQGDRGMHIKILDEKSAKVLSEVPDEQWARIMPRYEKAN